MARRPSGGPSLRLVPLRLGSAWAWSAIRSRGAVAWGTILGCTVLTLTMLVTLSTVQGLSASDRRDAARNPAMADRASATFMAEWSTSPYRDGQLTVVTVAEVEGRTAPPPPGLDRLPRPGEVWLSPALRTALEKDSTLAGRIRGRTAGIIGPRGLSSPRELFAVVGVAALDEGLPSASWGTSWAPSGHPQVPLGATLTILLVLVGLPLAVLALSLARLAGAARRRRCSSLALLGVPTWVLSRALATEASIHALVGSLTGVAVGTVVLPLSATRGWLGSTWFAAEAWLPGAVVVLCVVTVVAGVGVMSAKQAAAAVDEPLTAAREPAPLRARLLRVTVLAVGMAGLSLITVLSRGGDSSALPQGVASVAFAGAVGLAVIGLVVATPVIVVFLGGNLPGRDRSATLMVTAARLAQHGPRLTGATIGLAVLLVGGFTGIAVVTDMDAGNTAPPGGEVLVFSPNVMNPGQAQAFRRVLDLPAQASVLQVSQARTEGDVATGDAPSVSTAIGTCDSLARLAEASVMSGIAPREAVDAVRSTCRQGALIPVSMESPDRPGALPAVAGLSISGLAGASTFRAVPPAQSTAPLQDPHLYVIAGAGNEARDAYLSQALALTPAADVQVEGKNTYAPIVPLLRGIIRRCTMVGVLVSLFAFLLVAVDQVGERRLQEAPLVVMGVKSPVLSRISIVENAIVTGVVCLAGTLVGWQACAAYLGVGHSGASPLRAPLSASLALGIVVLQGAAVTALSLRRRAGDGVVADLRTT